jgi:hypothetical protein
MLQLWLSELLCEAIAMNMAHVVARLSPPVLGSLCEQGMTPTIEAILAHDVARPDRKAA